MSAYREEMFRHSKPIGCSEALAERFHEVYEALAPSFAYETRKQSRVPWEQVPAENKELMLAVAEIVWRDICLD